jgi:membrane associated rhomboid family serine protease
MNLTLIIIIITSIVSFMAFSNAVAFYKLKFNAALINHNRQYYRFITYGFIHADWMHLLVNMFVLFSFGTAVENSFQAYFSVRGPLFFLLLYFGGLAFSTLPAFSRHKNNDYYNAVGASGAVSAVLFSAIIMNPQMSIVFLFFPVPTPAWIFGILYLVYSAYMAKKGTDNIGHDAHFWGAVFGLVFTIALNPAFVSMFFDYFFS